MNTDVCWLDIETVKVEAPAGWPNRMRWMPVMVGVGSFDCFGEFLVELFEADDLSLASEAKLMAEVSAAVEPFGEIVYNATREFDEMILKGRFTNARRAHTSEPGSWPHLRFDGEWRNLKSKVRIERIPDIESRLVPDAWKAGEREVIRTHCRRDVIDNVLIDPTDAGLMDAVERERLMEVMTTDRWEF